MLFSSLEFLFLFLPLFLTVYFTCKGIKTRNILLLGFSLFFYAWGEPVYIFIMLISIMCDYTFGICISRNIDGNKRNIAKRYMIASIAVNLFILGFFKYYDFFVENLSLIPALSFLQPLGLSLPIGISFYTFQTMSYTIDLYKGKTKVQKNITAFGAYVAAFPQLVAGPVVRYHSIAEELMRRKETIGDFTAGMKRFIAGLAKKVLIANNMAVVCDNILEFSAADYGVLGAWIAMIAYTMQIYFDFSGYSDMAIGIGRMMGFKYPENFNYPYIATSITDFWRRWHITMSSFFRDYVYIPLGGNRVSNNRWLFNMLVVWAITGLWHGADWTFILWGMYFGLILTIEKFFIGKYLAKLPGIKNIYSLFFIIIGWVIFRADSVAHAGEILRAMFGGYGAGGADMPLAMVLQQSEAGTIFFIALAAAIIASMPASRIIKEKLRRYKYGALAMDICILLVFGVCAMELVIGSYNPFIYFDF